MLERISSEETEEYHAQLLDFVEQSIDEQMDTETELNFTKGESNASTIN